MENSEKELIVAESIESEKVETQEQENSTDVSDESEFTESKEESESQETNTDEVGDEETSEESSEEVKKEQDSDENSKFAQVRRKAEEEAKLKIEAERKKAYEQGKLEAYKGKVNPYTDKPITDLADVEMYEVMFQLDKEGKDPIKDLPEALATKRREEAKAIQEKKAMEDKVKQDVENFIKKYPTVDVSELLKDELFNDYILGKNKPLIELYEGYNKLKNSFRTDAVNVAKQTIANSIATPGSLGNEASTTIDYSSMSDEEFEKVLNAVKNGELK